MVNKIIIAIMVALLSINLYSWHKLTAGNQKEIKRITSVIEQCNNSSK
jgi:hypothetical protein